MGGTTKNNTFRIESPYFVAGCHDGQCAPIIKYMRDWPISRVRSYCKSKGWLLMEYPDQPARELVNEEVGYTNERLNMNQDYTSIFTGIARSKSMGGGYAPRLGLGTHRLALKSYKVKDSTKGQGQFLEAEFVVINSTRHTPGETVGWVWFINASGQWAAAYEQDRAKKFLEAVGACVGDDSPVEVIGANLASPNQAGKGLIIDVEIMPQGGKNAGKTNQRGEPYTNSFWKPVKQTLEELAASRAEIEQIEAQPRQETAPATPAPAPRQGLGLLGGKK